MTWIDSPDPEAAEGRLRKLYDAVRGPRGQVDRVLQAHGLRPHTLEGHLALYKATLHHPGNRLPGWLLEAIGVYVSVLNGCRYCVEHHAVGMARRLGEGERAAAIRAALEAGRPEEALDEAHAALMRYAEELTRRPDRLTRATVDALRDHGFDDGEILEANQVAAYFAYVNRTVLGLGVEIGDEALGLAPSGDDLHHR